jgi:hypothetical protein
MRGIAAVAVSGSLLAAAQNAEAATVTVSGFGDDGGTAACSSNVCPSLRDAIDAIDSGAIAAGSTPGRSTARCRPRPMGSSAPRGGAGQS